MAEQNKPIICWSRLCKGRELAPNEDYFQCPGVFRPRGQNEAVRCSVTMCVECGKKHSEGPDGHKCICRTYWFDPIFHKRSGTTAA